MRTPSWVTRAAAGTVLAATFIAVTLPRPCLAQATRDAAPIALGITLLAPDSAKPPSFPDSSWRAVLHVLPGRQAGVRIVVSGGEPAVRHARVTRLQGALVWSAASWTRDARPDSISLSAARFQGSAVPSDGADTVYAYLGHVPLADTVRLLLWVPGGLDSTVLAEREVWARTPSGFTFGSSLGVSIALNDTASRSPVRRVAMNGRLLLGQVRGLDRRPACRVWAFWSWPTCLVPQGRWLRGAFLMEGEFLLGLAAIESPDSAATTAAGFAESAEGALRVEVPVFDLGNGLALRAFGQGGFVSVRGRPDFWLQQYWGLRLGIDQADVSGRQSYVEGGLGFSDNLRPRKPRIHVAVQWRVPEVPVVVQLTFNWNRKARADPALSDNPVVFSLFAPLDLAQLLKTVMGGQNGVPSGGVGS